MNTLDHWVLSLIVFLPAMGAVAITCLPRRQVRSVFVLAIATSGLAFVASMYVLARFDFGTSETAQFAASHMWVDQLDIRYHVFVDGISLPLLLLSTLVTFSCIVYSVWHVPQPRNTKAFCALILGLEVGVNGSFVAQDLILFFVFFEAVLVPMYFLIAIWGGERRQYAALKFFVYTVFGSALMLVAFLALYVFGGNTFDIPQLITSAQVDAMSSDVKMLIFLGLFIGLAIKVPVFPFHTWMTDAHTEAPTVASVLLAGVLLKIGAYGLIRIALPILPREAASFAPWIAIFAVTGIIYGALGCLAQRDLKRLIAFSSLAHMGFVMLGIATLTEVGINASIFAMVGHGLITGMLFFVCGSIHHRLETRDLSRFGGLLAIAPRLTWVLGMCAVASLAMPGFAGFWGEFGAVLAAFHPAEGLSIVTFRVCMVVGALGTVLAAGYLMWMYQKVAFGEPSDAVKARVVQDVSFAEYVAWTPLLLLIVVLGIFPGLVLSISNASVGHLVDILGAQR